MCLATFFLNNKQTPLFSFSLQPILPSPSLPPSLPLLLSPLTPVPLVPPSSGPNGDDSNNNTHPASTARPDHLVRSDVFRLRQRVKSSAGGGAPGAGAPGAGAGSTSGGAPSFSYSGGSGGRAGGSQVTGSDSGGSDPRSGSRSLSAFSS